MKLVPALAGPSTISASEAGGKREASEAAGVGIVSSELHSGTKGVGVCGKTSGDIVGVGTTAALGVQAETNKIANKRKRIAPIVISIRSSLRSLRSELFNHQKVIFLAFILFFTNHFVQFLKGIQHHNRVHKICQRIALLAQRTHSRPNRVCSRRAAGHIGIGSIKRKISLI